MGEYGRIVLCLTRDDAVGQITRAAEGVTGSIGK